jgi:hypothetical protein
MTGKRGVQEMRSTQRVVDALFKPHPWFDDATQKVNGADSNFSITHRLT